VLIAGAVSKGSVDNLQPLFTAGFGGMIGVAAMLPFMFTGFDVIPQAAEEIDLPPRTIGVLIAVSVVTAAIFYIAIVGAVALILPHAALPGVALASADAAAAVWGPIGSTVLIVGGIAGIVTSWNAFLIGGSRVMFALADSRMLPAVFDRLHPRFRTPHVAILFIGALSAAAPFAGRETLVWIVDAGSFAAIVAYLLVAMSFIRLRAREPDLARPLRLPGGTAIGWLGIACTLAMALVYLPGSPAALKWPYEWAMLGIWIALGAALYALTRRARSPWTTPVGAAEPD